MIVFLCCYLVSYGCAFYGYYIVSGLMLMLAAIYLYGYDYQRTGNLIHLRGLFSLFWLGGQGLSCLKLSYLQTAWKPITWVCFFLALAGFWISYERLERHSNHLITVQQEVPKIKAHLLLQLIVVITIVSMSAFVVEAVKLGFIPLLIRGVPHAYSAFHISGLHYFTVSCVLVPGLAVLYLLLDQHKSHKQLIVAAVMTILAMMIPLLCVSRFQLIFSVLVAALTYISVKQNIKLKYVIGIFVLVIPLYLVLTIARSHDVNYLNDIFEMRNKNMPIVITQPYMYIANNYDNFNCLVESLPNYTLGMRMLFPVWALSGLKFIFPQLVNFPLYLNKPELTTLTIFYDAYYDFGILGILISSSLLGILAFYLTTTLKYFKNPISYLFYAQIAVYMMLSFFTTWFSNPTTWFYFVVTSIGWIYYHLKAKEKSYESVGK